MAEPTLQPPTDAEVAALNASIAQTLKSISVQIDELMSERRELRAKVTALEAEQEVLVWNLGGCSTYALGYDLDKDPAPTMARPALHDVRKLAREAELLRTDAARYRCLRAQHWNDSSLFVVCGSNSQIRLGTYCPSDDQLDVAVDAMIKSRPGKG